MKAPATKLSIALSAISLAFTFLAARAQEPPKLAEQQFKNIKTLKGIPADQIFPAMQFITASLGVDCEYCHVRDGRQMAFDKDDKKPKLAARKMIEMMNAINKDNFESKKEVTCNTCHMGSPHPQRAPSIMGVKRNTITRGTAATPQDVLKKYQTAIGGNLASVKFEGTATGFGPKSTAITIFQGNPNKFTMAFNDEKIGFDGTGAWFQQGSGKAVALPADQATPMVHFGRFFRGGKRLSSNNDEQCGLLREDRTR